MRPDAVKESFVGCMGTPSPDDPIFTGKAVIDAVNTEPSDYVGKTMPMTNVSDNKEFREALKKYLVEHHGFNDDTFSAIEDEQWKIIKSVENNIYYEHARIEDNVMACANYLGYNEDNELR